MHFDPFPVYRRAIVPWYDSDGLCWLVIVFMASVFLFSMAGLSVVGQEPAYRDCVWVPLALAGSAGTVMATTAMRLLRRRGRRPPQ
jgi:hypothetical protein